MPTPLFRINAFSQDPFGGNPAAICFLDREAHPDWMQAVAAELDLAETAFLLRKGDDFGLRWFTPTVEVPLCGHATLASAHAIWEAGRSDPEATLRFQTKSGLLEARRQGDSIWLDFPALPPSPAAAPPGLIEALGIRPSYVGRGSEMFFLVEVESADAVRALRPAFAHPPFPDPPGRPRVSPGLLFCGKFPFRNSKRRPGVSRGDPGRDGLSFSKKKRGNNEQKKRANE